MDSAGDGCGYMVDGSLIVNHNLGFDGVSFFLSRIAASFLPSFGSLLCGVNNQLQDFFF